MSDAFYSIVRRAGIPAFWLSGRGTVMGVKHTRRAGAFILAATHQSAYDVPLLIDHCGRPLDFVSTVEVFSHPFAAWFYGSMNAFPLDRGRTDIRTVRVILDRLARGRAVAMFPEGGLRPGEASVLSTGRLPTGIGRLARLADVPIVPAVLINSGAYTRPSAWLPLRRTRYGVAFGSPIPPGDHPRQLENQLVEQFGMLHGRLAGEMGKDQAKS